MRYLNRILHLRSPPSKKIIYIYILRSILQEPKWLEARRKEMAQGLSVDQIIEKLSAAKPSADEAAKPSAAEVVADEAEKPSASEVEVADSAA